MHHYSVLVLYSGDAEDDVIVKASDRRMVCKSPIYKKLPCLNLKTDISADVRWQLSWSPQRTKLLSNQDGRRKKVASRISSRA